MFAWLQELLEIRYQNRVRNQRLREELATVNKVCSSCEILKEENNALRLDNQRLLDRILEKPTPEPERMVAPEPITRPRMHMNWKVKQQMLEAEDRQRAAAMRNAAQPDTVEDLEKELDIVSAEREANSGASATAGKSN